MTNGRERPARAGIPARACARVLALALPVVLGAGAGVAGAAPVVPDPSPPTAPDDRERLAAYDEALVALTQELSYLVLLGWAAVPVPEEARELPAAIGIQPTEPSIMVDELRFLDGQRGPAALASLRALGEPVVPAVAAVLATNLPPPPPGSGSGSGPGSGQPSVGTAIYLEAYDQLLGPWAQLTGLDASTGSATTVPAAAVVTTASTTSVTQASTAATPAATAPNATTPSGTTPSGTTPNATTPTAADSASGAGGRAGDEPIAAGDGTPLATGGLAALAAVAALLAAAAVTVGVLRRRSPRRTPAAGDDVLDAGRTIMAAVEVDSFVRSVAEQAGRLVDADGAIVIGDRSCVPSARPLPDRAVIDRATSTGRSVRTDAATVVPIVADGTVIGVLVGWTRRPQAEEVLGAFAPLVGAAWQGVRSRTEHEHLAFDDGLTGVGNRRRFDRDLERFVGIDSGRGLPVALAMVDVDHFKRFNDAHGHQTGDAVLRHVADVIAAHVRSGDLVYRYGGEEFAVLLPGADLDEAMRVVERVRAAIAVTPLPVQAPVAIPPVTVSVGVSATPQVDAAAMVRSADGALYAAKAGGRNRVEAVVGA